MSIEHLTIERKGQDLEKAKKVLVMLHGRGDRAINFITLSDEFELSDFAILALQAKDNTWYPYSFMAPDQDNEPFLTNSLSNVDLLVNHILTEGIDSRHIYFMGFSQGACLTLEYTSRNAKRYGGIIAFTGGLIGEKVENNRYQGDFEGTPVFIGSSDHDPHVPEHRIDESEKVMIDMGAKVNKIIYPGMGHTINQDEIEKVKNILNT